MQTEFVPQMPRDVGRKDRVCVCVYAGLGGKRKTITVLRKESNEPNQWEVNECKGKIKLQRR